MLFLWQCKSNETQMADAYYWAEHSRSHSYSHLRRRRLLYGFLELWKLVGHDRL